ncbi:MAG TPA: hypothetical protein PK280_10815 [Planctomycetota bacterium]|nr:hypothetical protein [Planctomycetota bacterium]
MRSGRRRLLRGACIAAALLGLYLASYWGWSRWFPGRQGTTADGRRWYTFVAGDPDWEYTLASFYWPLVKMDAAWFGVEHRFDVVYLGM